MKTPREILLARHQAAEPKLDAVRQRTIAGIEREPHERSVPWFQSIREFFRVPRVAWGGLAAAWLVIITLNHASRETNSTRTAPSQEAKRSPETLLALREQKRFFAELVGVASEKLDAEAPRFVPRPRSEGPAPIAFA
jgi:hypothetical protein